MFRKTKFPLVLFAFLAAIIAMPSAVSARENSLKKEKWALQFEVDRDFDLNAFQGSTITVKRHSSDKSAYRLSLTTHLDFKDESTDFPINGQPAPGHNDFTDVKFEVAVKKISYTNPQGNINFFWGIGPVYGYQYFLIDQDNITSDRLFQIKYKREEHTWSLGLNGILGVEWFATKSISFLAEYATTAGYTERNSKSVRKFVSNGIVTYDIETTADLSELSFSSSQVKFGLSVYF